MAWLIRFTRGTTAQVAAETPEVGEPHWDSEADKLYVGDGSTAGGILIGPGAAGAAHDLGGASHSADTLAHLNTKVSDATLFGKELFSAYSILAADTNNTPAAVALAASRLIGRKSTGGIVALAKADILTIINVTEGADITGDNAPQAHAIPGSHTFAGMTIGHVLRASAADAAAFAALLWADVDKTTSDIADITTKSHTSLTDVGSNAHSVIDTHLGSSSNPHSVTATQVGKATAQWNADKLQGRAVQDHAPVDTEVLTWVAANTQWEPAAAGGGITAAAALSYAIIASN